MSYIDWDDDFMDMDQYERVVRLRRFPPSHLSAPLTYFPQEIILKSFLNGSEPPGANIQQAIEVLEEIKKKHRACKYTTNPTEVYSRLFSGCYNDFRIVDRKIERTLFKIIKSCSLEWSRCRSAIEAFHPGLKGCDFELTESQCRGIAKALSNSYDNYRNSTHVRNQMQKDTIPFEKKVREPVRVGGLLVYTKGDSISVVYDLHDPKAAILNYDQWTMIVDTLASRFISQMATMLNDESGVDCIPSYRVLISLYKWGDDMIRESGMNAYALLGEFESLVTSILVTFKDSDPLDLGQDYIDAVYQSSEELLQEYSIPLRKTTEILEILRNISSVNVLSEIFGLRKHWGIPMVCARASGRAIQEKLNEYLPIKATALDNLLASFNRMITLAFIDTHHQWPQCIFEKHEASYPLYDAWVKKTTRIHERVEGHEHLHWTRMRFLPNCILDSYENQLTYLTDKSVSLPVDELDAVYFKGFGGNDDISTTHDRRLILEFIRKDQLTILDVMKIVMSGEIPKNWLANSAAMKGTEMKYLKARVFAVLTFELRQYFSISEDMIKKHLFPYNPFQTMTLSEDELLKKLNGITRQLDVQGESRFLNVMHIIDFSKWNLRMRYENTHQIFRSIDDFLGTPTLIESSHLIIEGMTNLIQDPYNPPARGVKHTEDETIWRLHDRGWEGQRQKGWTALTSAALADVERRTGIRSEICGQGDNQTLLTSFPIPSAYRNPREWIDSDKPGVKKILDDYYKVLEETCGDIGLKVKTAETCRSLCYLNYGKRLYFSGIELSMTLKRLSKAMTDSNDTFPITEDRLKTSEGASYAAGLYSNPSPWPYIISRMCTLLILHESFLTNPLVGDFGNVQFDEKTGCTEIKMLAILMQIPSSLGGPPQQQFSSFLCRGHPDPLCNDLVMTCLKAKSGCKLNIAIMECLYKNLWISSDNKDRSSLIHAPYSLNLKTPMSAKKPIAREVLPALLSACNNTKVREVLSASVTDYEKDLLHKLSMLEPFNPLIANEIYSRSVAGKRQSFVEGLKNSTSMCRLVSDTGESRLLNEIIELEKQQLIHWVKMVYDVIQNTGKEPRNFPPHHILARELREKSWGIKFEGVTVPHPLEIFTLVVASDDICTHHEDTQYPEFISFVRHSDSLKVPIGSDSKRVQMIRSKTGSPFLGSRINEGVTSRQLLCKNPTESWNDACRLNIVKKWIAEPGGELEALIDQVISTRTDADSILLDMVTGRPSRLSYTHRASLLGTRKVCSITTVSNMYTRIYTSSNRMGDYSAGELNYHLPFGPTFLTYSSLICLYGALNFGRLWSQVKSEIYHCHITTNTIPVVYDGRIELSRDNMLKDMPSMENPPELLFTKVLDLEFEDRNINAACGFFLKNARLSPLDKNVGYAMTLIGDAFIKEVSRRELMSVDAVSSFPKRDASITVGDLKLTGVLGMVRAVAQNVILCLDYKLIRTYNVEAMAHGVEMFLGWFSDAFWSRATSAMIHSSLVDKLQKLAGSGSIDYRSSSTQTLKSIFIAAVTQDAVRLLEALRLVIASGGASPFNLYVPNIRVATYMYGKFCELCVWLRLKYDLGLEERAYDRGRKLVRGIYKVEEPTVMKLFVEAKRLFCHVNKELVMRNGIEYVLNPDADDCKLPEIKVFDFSEPWIDMVRDLSFHNSDLESSSLVNIRKGTSGLVEMFEVDIGTEEVMYQSSFCSCVSDKFDFFPRIDDFFCRTGIYGDDHLYCAYVLSSFNPDLRTMLVLGDPHGEIALAMTGIPECMSVYCASSLSLTDYDPHLASTSVPSAFLGSGNRAKLHEPGSAAMIGNPLGNNDVMKKMLSQTSDLRWGGAIIKVNLRKSDGRKGSDVLEASPLYDSLSTLFGMRLGLSWCLVLLIYKCHHDVAHAVNFFSHHYSSVTLCTPYFSHPKAKKITIFCQRRNLDPPNYSHDRIRASLVGKSELYEHVMKVSNTGAPLLFYKPVHFQRKALNLCGYDSNFRTRCCSYIKGWGRYYSTVPSVSVICEDLLEIENMSISSALTVFKAQFQFKRTYSLPRSKVLMIKSPKVNSQIQEIMLDWFKSRVLRCCLDQAITHPIETAITLISESLENYRTFELDGEFMEVGITAKQFMKHHSGNLFAILGHIWGTGTLIDMSHIEFYHSAYGRPLSPIQFNYPIPLQETKSLLFPNAKFKWEQRAQLLCLLMVGDLSGECVSCRDIPAHMVSYVNRSLEASQAAKGWKADSSKTDVCWLTEDEGSAHSAWSRFLQTEITCPFFAVVQNRDYGYWKDVFSIDKRLRIPWSGIIPDIVMLRVTGPNFEIWNSTSYVDIHSTVDNYYDVATLYGCHCYDCAVESYLIRKLQLQPGDIDQLSRHRKGESVFDHDHSVFSHLD